jgi:hypothetical protein
MNIAHPIFMPPGDPAGLGICHKMLPDTNGTKIRPV